VFELELTQECGRIPQPFFFAASCCWSKGPSTRAGGSGHEVALAALFEDFDLVGASVFARPFSPKFVSNKFNKL
jgi:hypothetical protein